jgi:hypothetical protein
MEVAIFLVGITLCGAAFLWLGCVLVRDLMVAREGASRRGTDPTTGPRDRIAVYDHGGPFVSMPDQLKTRDEMVEWLTKELPKLTSDARRSDS